MKHTTLSLFLLAATLTGCVSTDPNLAPEQIKTLSSLNYPAEADFGDDLDILIIRDGEAIDLLNRTPRSYRNVTLWYNQQYAQAVDEITIGTDNRLSLRKAVDKHGRAYPVGSFLKPDTSLRLVEAILYDPTTELRHRLTVQPSRGRDR